MEEVEIRLVREGIAESVVAAGLGHARGNAMGGHRLGQHARCSHARDHIADHGSRNEHPVAEPLVARIDVGDSALGSGAHGPL